MQVRVDYGGKCYCGGCRIDGRDLIFEIPGLGRWATDASLADNQLGEAARVLAGILLPHLIRARLGSHPGEPQVSILEGG